MRAASTATASRGRTRTAARHLAAGRSCTVGLRNPWRISFDPAGRLWIGDVGQDRYEEIDVLARGARGLDLGWSCWEGRHSYDTSQCRRGAGYTAPVIELAHPGLASARDLAAQSITGGYVYRGRAYASSAGGAYVFGDWVTGNLWAYRDGALAHVGTLAQVTSFGEDDRRRALRRDLRRCAGPPDVPRRVTVAGHRNGAPIGSRSPRAGAS